MKLSAFIESRNFTQDEFARMVGVHPNTLRNWLKGIIEPRLSSAFRVEEVTKGKVTAKELAEEWLYFEEARKKFG